MSRFDNYDFDRYMDMEDDFADAQPSGGSCYCKTMMLCSYCAKGYN